MIQHIIDTTFWMKHFAYNREEVEEIKQACEVAGYMKELTEKVSQWHHDRNLIDGATSKDPST